MKLEVKNCPRIVRFPRLLPSLKILSVANINQMLLGSVANYTSLTELSVGGFPEVKCLPEELGPNHGVLHTFEIRDCPKLMSVSNQLENLHALKTLVLDGCTDLVLSLPDWGLQNHQQQQQCPPLSSLQRLEISNSCENQTSLPGDGIVLTSLSRLNITSCKNIESLSDDMLRHLTILEIDDCPKVFSSPVSLKNLNSLKLLRISRCPGMMNLLQHAESLTSLTWLRIRDCPGMSSLPESIGDLTSLTQLWIRDCPGMSSVPESIGDLTSLTVLVIRSCPEITTLPEGLQRLTNLRHLSIRECPILQRRLRCDEGQDWHKVAHVPRILIDGQDPRDSLSSVGRLSLMDSLKMGCNIFNTKKLLLPSCCSSSPSSSSTSPPT
ncbi:hypothetical protein MRB53_034303 [Persea americana]|uniref:Uncharacterized protein n=1 Tax=Persea americana TaxID=3435 RepID=A0ACC2KXD1_PERAE|nr:hypothetical protein MRB53_034303 [Persea americana]